MENISNVKQYKEILLEIDIHPYLFDHQFMGNAVLPAVEAMQELAKSIHKHHGNINNCYISNARFLRFLNIKENQEKIEAYNQIEIAADGNIVSSLVTVSKLRGGTITRKKEHVKVEFSANKEIDKELLFKDVFQLNGDVFEVNSQKIYKDLVPFLKSYHNIVDDIFLNSSGVVAKIKAPDFRIEHGPLGSPFVFDAAFHAACVWGQRFACIVGFPVGLQERHILKPTEAGETYLARVFPLEQKDKNLVFDIWIYDLHGEIYETIRGVAMSDVSSGKMKPPEWIVAE